MTKKKLYLLSGIPGSGKSTWAHERVKKDGGTWISRDAIRFSLLKEEDDYFSLEDLVIEKFISSIQAAINDSSISIIYVDATHLNKKARDSILNKLDLTNITKLICVYCDIDLKIALERNKKRTGRALVPDTVIKNMFFSHKMPDEDEDFDQIIIIDEQGNEVYINGYLSDI